MSLKKFLLAFALVMAYFGLNYAFLSDQSYDSMKDYIETTKNEFSYEVENIIYEEEWTGFHIKMISGEWLDKKKVKDIVNNFSKNTQSEVITMSTLEKKTISKIKAKLISYAS